MKLLRALPLLLSVLALTLPTLTLRADRTLRGKLRKIPAAKEMQRQDATAEADTVRFDTIVSPPATIVRLSGYDKPLNSRVESLFVSNLLDRDISELQISLTYTDLKGRTLHKVSRRVRADIPAKNTRRIQFASWDTQNSFYYRYSRRPRTANVSPYDVSCQVDTCILLPLPPALSDSPDPSTLQSDTK